MRGFGEALMFFFVVACIATPLAIWKLVEIVIWLCSHLSFSWT